MRGAEAIPLTYFSRKLTGSVAYVCSCSQSRHVNKRQSGHCGREVRFTGNEVFSLKITNCAKS